MVQIARYYRKKPVVVRAIQWRGDNFHEIDAFVTCEHDYPMIGQVRIKTLEGWMVASDGDYIIEGVRGEFYPCNTDVFKATYEEV